MIRGALAGRRTAAVLLVIAAIGGAGCAEQASAPATRVPATITASGPRFDSIAALRTQADAIVLGRVGAKVREHPIVSASGEEFYREVVHDVAVERAYLQPGVQVSLGASITVVTPDAAATIENATGLGPLQGRQVLLFLRVAPNPDIAQFMATGEDNGIFDVSDGTARVRSTATDLRGVEVRVDEVLPPATPE